jgi:hypothetical protein
MMPLQYAGRRMTLQVKAHDESLGRLLELSAATDKARENRNSRGTNVLAPAAFATAPAASAPILNAIVATERCATN